jgi:predicted Fe-S protein YdhL (DUF1289 family)
MPIIESPTIESPAIESPCIKICVVDPVCALCTGCGRTLAEIEHWVRFSPAERRRIMDELPSRLAARRLARRNGASAS